MDVVEKEAAQFSKFFLQRTSSIRFGKEEIDKRLSIYPLEKHKLYYLTALRKNVELRFAEHNTTCKKSDCTQAINLPFALFVIDQEKENIEQYYKPKIESSDDFSMSEKAEIHHRVNEIFEQLEKLGLGQEILFNDLDELRQHFNLGKKNWLKFLKGTLITVAMEKGIEKTIVDPIYQKLSEAITDIQSMIDKTS